MTQPLEKPIRVFFYEEFPLYGARQKVDRRLLTQQAAERIAIDPECGRVSRLSDN